MIHSPSVWGGGKKKKRIKMYNFLTPVTNLDFSWGKALEGRKVQFLYLYSSLMLFF